MFNKMFHNVFLSFPCFKTFFFVVFWNIVLKQANPEKDLICLKKLEKMTKLIKTIFLNR